MNYPNFARIMPVVAGAVVVAGFAGWFQVSVFGKVCKVKG
jgi:hypothetical protein